VKLRTPSPATVLVIVTCVWASTFTVTKDLLAVVPPLRYLALRFGLGVLVLLPVLVLRLRHASPGLVRDSLVLGLFNVFGLGFQVLGQIYTTASKSAFITSLNTPLTALVGFVCYRIIPVPAQRLAMALASLGLLLLSWPPAGATFNPGDLLTVCCAVLYAFFITESARRAPRHDAALLAIGQALVAAATFALLLGASVIARDQLPESAWPTVLRLELRPFPRSAHVYWQLAYMSIICVALISIVQTWALRRLTAATAAVIYALEPVVATAIATAMYGASEWPGARGITGGILVLIAVYAAEGRSLRRASPTSASTTNAAMPAGGAERDTSQPCDFGPQR
jgi:drug/metabolite transporter (DMT)-like permease